MRYSSVCESKHIVENFAFAGNLKNRNCKYLKLQKIEILVLLELLKWYQPRRLLAKFFCPTQLVHARLRNPS